MTRVVIFNDGHGWHSDQLEAALAPYGITLIRSNLAQCRIDLDRPTGLHIPGLGAELPDGVLVRGVAAGSFEQITLRLDVLHALAELGVPVLNSPLAIERTVDKARTSLLLRYKGVPTPRTWACEDWEQARLVSAQAHQEKHELVLKPLFGCQGQGITRIGKTADLETCEVSGGLYYLQEFIPPAQPNRWQDWRLFVVDHRCIAAMVRRGRSWITNVARGAECFPAALDREMGTLACQATRAVAVDYAGVDIIQTPDKGFQVLEVNSVPSWKALQQTTGINIAKALAEALLKRLQHPYLEQSSW
ncbi:alpha-L-glutamate ligase, RimK family [Nitrosococcus halophilus Nc 4]|uniref:Alpha-L-glutamate ligase, RimK family n=1 Tax=Nitrosococcus halophilus (strain Nc4) TaxID=472759 RepID=D5C3I2_NITHN|nr:RimK family alpha-L-glutamate ligase [Nitrosococcus halophilus]ADE16889.1 alpha-L-glutamate ligase, RimK family [Nitrosococcus halophilus Nc 4]